MGLLEKALQFKNELNNRGRETLIDKIIGPAETVMLQEKATDTKGKRKDAEPEQIRDIDGDKGEEDIVFLEENELSEIDKKNADHAHETKFISEEMADDADQSIQKKIKSSKQSTNSDYDVQDLEINDFENDDFNQSASKKIHDDYSAEVRDTLEESRFKGIFSDYMTLFENCRELAKTKTVESYFETLSFIIMGQIGVSSSSLLLHDIDKSDKWRIAESKGIIIEDKELDFSIYSGILSLLDRNHEIIDIENFKDDEAYTDEFYKYISIDARLLIPLVLKNELIGVVTIGDKITSDVYTDEEKDYLYAIGEFSATQLYSIQMLNRNARENESLEKIINYSRDLEKISDQITAKPEIDNLKEVISGELRSLGVECFGVFIRSTNYDRYIPVIFEKEDYLLYRELDFSIKSKSHFSTFLQEGEVPLSIDDIMHSRILSDVFNENQMSRFSIVRLYPFRFGSEVPGFIMINRVADLQRLHEIDLKMKRLAAQVFPLIISIENLNIKRKKYIDNIEMIYKKIDDEINNARNLNIPLTLVLFSIKNYKRYYNLYGIEEAKKLLEQFEKIVKTRLSDGDFCVRYDRHKILLTLPGKDKKFAVPLANTIRNEIVQGFRKKEIQLLLTFLTAEFPDDGNNVYSLIDAID